MKKALKIILIIFGILILVIGAGVYYFLKPEKTVAATLYITQGIVEILENEQWKVALDGQEVSVGDNVRTGSDGKANIIFYDSSVIRLDPNSEIIIEGLDSSKDSVSISLKQKIGQTWVKALKLSGVETRLDIETPTTVATIRGTSFGILINEQGTDVVVAEGVVEVQSYKTENGQKKFIGKQEVRENQEAIVITEKLEEVKSTPVREKYKELIKKEKERDIEFLEELKVREVYKYGKLIEVAKSQMDATDKQIREVVRLYRSGEEEKQEIANYLVPKELINRLDNINTEIKKLEIIEQTQVQNSELTLAP